MSDDLAQIFVDQATVIDRVDKGFGDFAVTI